MTLEEAKQLKPGDTISTSKGTNKYIITNFELRESSNYLRWNIEPNRTDFRFSNDLSFITLEKKATQQLFKIY